MQSSVGMSIQPNQPARNSRLRAAATNLPLGLDFRTQYRSVSRAQSPNQATTARASGSSSHSATSYTFSFSSAPLTAPVDFSLPRNSRTMGPGAQDYSISQMSAPIIQPNDFCQAFQASLSSPTTRTPTRDSFSENSLHQGQRNNAYGDHVDSNSFKRKASYSAILGKSSLSSLSTSISTSHSIF
jgi:hypothetical protein